MLLNFFLCHIYIKTNGLKIDILQISDVRFTY